MGFNEMAYEEHPQELRLPSLEQRRKVVDLVQLHNQLVLQPLHGSAVSVQLHPFSSGTHGHSHRVSRPYFKTATAFNSFPSRTVNSWNVLENVVASARDSFNFRKLLQRHSAARFSNGRKIDLIVSAS